MMLIQLSNFSLDGFFEFWMDGRIEGKHSSLSCLEKVVIIMHGKVREGKEEKVLF